MHSIVQVNPFRCRMSTMHDRLDAHITEETCRIEIQSFLKHGQLVPVLGRPLRNDPLCEVELIYGARRLFVARHLNVPLKVELRELGDRESIVALDIENRQRKDVSPYERGRSFARWIQAGYFRSQDDIGRTLRISSSQVSRLLKLARLPSVIVDAFSSPLDICEGWGTDLMDALEDPRRRRNTLSAARIICEETPRPQARDVYKRLLAASAEGRKIRVRAHDEVVKDGSGHPLFRIRQQASSIAVVLPLEKVSARTLDSIRRVLSDLLQIGNSQAADLSKQKTDNPNITSSRPASTTERMRGAA
jgi:ParB family chromosome partitioning protein